MAEPIAPFAVTEVWQAVMEAAGHRCQCTYRQHPAHRKHQGGRCIRTTADTRLIAQPANPGPHPERTIATPPVAELAAWCGDCWDHAVAQARKGQRDRDRHDQKSWPGLW